MSQASQTQNETSYRTLIDNAIDVISILDTDGRIRFCSPSTRAVLGYDPAELTGHNSFALIHPDDRARTERVFKQCLEHPGDLYRTEFLLLHKDGRWISLESLGRTFTDPSGVQRVVLSSRDVSDRAGSHKALQAGLSRAQPFLEIAPAAVVVLNPEGRIVFINSRGAALLNRSASDMIGRSWFDDYLSPTGCEDLRRIFQRYVSGEEAILGYHESLLRTADGKEIRVAWHSALVRNSEGEIQGMMSVGDVFIPPEESRRLRRETEYMYQQILDAIPDMVLIKGPKSHIHWANKAFRAYYAMTNEQLNNLIDAPFNEPDYTQQYLRDDLAVFTTGKPLNILSEPVTRHDGVVRNFHTIKFPIFDTAGGVTMTAGVSRDIEDRQQAEEHRAWLASIVENSTDAIYSISLEGTILSWNPAAEALYGYTASEVLGRSADMLIPEDRIEEVSRFMQRIHAGERIPLYETARRHKDGRSIDVVLALSPVRDKTRQAWGAAVSARDITERRRMEQIVLQSEKLSAVGQLAAGVAHELNNPLSVILGFAEALRNRIAPSDRNHEAVASIVRESVRCRTLVQNLLTFSRQRQPGFREELPLDVLEAALSLIEAQTRVRNVTLLRDFTTDMSAVWMDRQQIQQVVINLCSNALDAMPQGGRLSVFSHQTATDWIIQVVDTGTGIPPEIQGRIMEPFFTTKDVGKGTGLGLSLAHEIVQRHRGQLEFQSKAGEGTRFTVRLPLHAPKQPSRP